MRHETVVVVVAGREREELLRWQGGVERGMEQDKVFSFSSSGQSFCHEPFLKYFIISFFYLLTILKIFETVTKKKIVHFIIFPDANFFFRL